MIGPISFIIGMGLLGAAGISKGFELSNRREYNSRVKDRLGDLSMKEIDRTIRFRFDTYGGFDVAKIVEELGEDRTKKLLRDWTLLELGFDYGFHDEEGLQKYLWSGDYLSPLYGEALWLLEGDKSGKPEQVKNEIMSEAANMGEYGTYENAKKQETLWRKGTIYGAFERMIMPWDPFSSYDIYSYDKKTQGEHLYDSLMLNKFGDDTQSEKLRNTADSIQALNILKSRFAQFEMIGIRESLNHPRYNIKPSQESIRKLFDFHVDEWETYGLGRYPDGRVIYENKHLVESISKMKNFWKDNKFLEHMKREREICFKFANKYDLSAFDLDEYDVMQFCLDGYGPRSTILCDKGLKLTNTDIYIMVKENKQKIKDKEKDLKKESRKWNLDTEKTRHRIQQELNEFCEENEIEVWDARVRNQILKKTQKSYNYKRNEVENYLWRGSNITTAEPHVYHWTKIQQLDKLADDLFDARADLLRDKEYKLGRLACEIYERTEYACYLSPKTEAEKIENIFFSWFKKDPIWPDDKYILKEK